MLDASSTYQDLERSEVSAAILPVGATEGHGPHLPLNTDSVQAEVVAERMAERLNAFLLPGIAFGNSQVLGDFKGTISVSPNTLATTVKEIGHCLLDQGFRRIVVLNGHGGNFILKTAVRELNLAQRQGKVILLNVYEVGELHSRVLDSASDDAHAGEAETSLMLHLEPEHVGDERVDHVPDVDGWVYFDYLRMKEFCPEGVWGRSSLATPEKGRQLLEGTVDLLVERVKATFARLEVAIDEKS